MPTSNDITHIVWWRWVPSLLFSFYENNDERMCFYSLFFQLRSIESRHAKICCMVLIISFILLILLYFLSLCPLTLLICPIFTLLIVCTVIFTVFFCRFCFYEWMNENIFKVTVSSHTEKLLKFKIHWYYKQVDAV